MTLFATAGVWAQSVPLPSPSLPSPGTQHTVGGTTFAHSSFEADSSLVLPTGSVFPTSTGPGAYPPAATWTWSGGGIAGKDSSITAITPPVGSFAAFLQSSNQTGVVGFSFSHTLSVPAFGMWRVAFLGAQRKHGTTVDQQTVRITVITQTAGGPIAEVVFEETLRDATYRKYYSRPFVAQAQTFTLLFEGIAQNTDPHTALLDAVDVRELVPWMEAATWAWAGSDIPGPTDDVIIPADSCVGLVTGEANTVEVQGELFVLDAGQAATLSTRRLEVHGAGSYFQCGLAGRPFLGSFTLTLDDDSTGSGEDVNVLKIHDDAVAEMHGSPKTSWTRLALTAPQGSPSITVAGVPSNWQIGDSIVIAASDRDFTKAEQRTIASMTPAPGGNTTIGFPSGAQLAHRHVGSEQSVVAPQPIGTQVLDQRAEVGMLSHNVKIIGQPRTGIGAGLGGHIMIHGDIHGAPPTLQHGGFARFSGIELDNMGRTGHLGRYPLHWHLLLDQGRGQYMKHSSIHHSNSRVVAVHGTDYIVFENNVAFEHIGHGIFLEDGSEQYNVFRDNLVLSTRRPAPGTNLLPSDIEPLDLFQNQAPASFWITNPHNTFVGNVVAGSEGTGYWFVLPTVRMGQSFSILAADSYFSTRPSPHQQTLGLFDGNSCHSSWLAFDVNDGIFTDAGDPRFQQVQRNITWRPHTGQLQTLSDFGAYACNVGIYTGEGETNLVFERSLVADVSMPFVIASHDIVRNSIVVQDSGNGLWPGQSSFPSYPACALVLYDGPARFDHVHLVGFDSPFVTMFRNAGAARRRTGVSMIGITAAQNLAGTPITGAGPSILWEDFSGTGSATDPQRWAFSIDNPDLSLGRPLGNTLPTIVCSHPMMLVDPGTIEFPLPNSLPLGNQPAVAFCSPFRFGYLRVICEELSGVEHPVTQPAPNPWFQLQYTRVAPNVMNEVFVDGFQTWFHKQMAVIVDAAGQTNGVSYNLAWTHTSVTAAPLRTEIRLSELQYGDAALIRLENYLPITSVRRATALNIYPDQRAFSWETLQGEVDAAALLTSSESGYFEEVSTGTLWLRIVAKSGAPGAALVLHTDGLGQVLEVNR